MRLAVAFWLPLSWLGRAPAAWAQIPALPTGPGAGAAVTDSTAGELQRTPGGVRYLVHTLGPGAPPQAGARLAVRYTAFLPNGRAFDATAASGGPLRFRLGRGEVIPGWDEVLALLPAGTRARIWVPARLAYGAKGVPDPDDETRYLVPPDTELIFELHVVSVR